ncbi:phage terminase small subunit-related protein [Paenibacillus sp. CMM36]
MSRERNPNRKKALKMWLDSGREMKLKDIALKLGVSDSSIRKWKALDKWSELPEKRKRGGKQVIGMQKGIRAEVVALLGTTKQSHMDSSVNLCLRILSFLKSWTQFKKWTQLK